MGAENQKQMPKEPEKTMKCILVITNRASQRVLQIDTKDEKGIRTIKKQA